MPAIDYESLRAEDIRLLRRAARGGWAVPEDALTLGPLELERIVREDDDIRNRLAAIRALDAMMGRNQTNMRQLLDLLKHEDGQDLKARIEVLEAAEQERQEGAASAEPGSAGEAAGDAGTGTGAPPPPPDALPQ